jgi:two-component system response regulator YesN
MGAPISLLIVEDDRDALKLLSLVVAKKFPSALIRIALDGRAGIERCLEEMPDIVVTDINMAEMDGMQMACEIKALKDNTRFIVLTGYSDREHLDSIRELGASDYIVKPINFKMLFAAIQKCIDEIGQGR